MTAADHPASSPLPDPAETLAAAASTPSRLATAIGRFAISAGRYPGRSIIGFPQRRRSRERGGRRFKVYRPLDITLDAWFSPRLPNTPSRLPVLIAHGMLETKERHFKQALRLNARGHDVLLFDQRVHGRSTGRRQTFGIEERHDVAAVFDDALRRQLIVADRYITLGFSLGASVVLQHAAIDPRVAGVIALAPFSDFRSAIISFRKTLTPWLNERWVLDGFTAASAEAGFQIDAASALHTFSQIQVPILLVEGGRDPFLPGADHVRRLAALKPDASIKVLHIAQASHNSLMHKRWPELEQAVRDFCDVVE